MKTIHIMVLLHHAFQQYEDIYSAFPAEYYEKEFIGEAHVYLDHHEYMKPADFGRITVMSYGTNYKITEKGRVFIDALMSVPEPVQAWTMPKPV